MDEFVVASDNVRMDENTYITDGHLHPPYSWLFLSIYDGTRMSFKFGIVNVTMSSRISANYSSVTPELILSHEYSTKEFRIQSQKSMNVS